MAICICICICIDVYVYLYMRICIHAARLELEAFQLRPELERQAGTYVEASAVEDFSIPKAKRTCPSAMASYGILFFIRAPQKNRLGQGVKSMHAGLCQVISRFDERLRSRKL